MSTLNKLIIIIILRNEKSYWFQQKNDAKQRFWTYNIKVNDLLQEVKSVLSDAHFEAIERITNILWVKNQWAKKKSCKN